MTYSDFCITLAYYWALFLLIFVIYTLLFEESSKKKRYKRPGYFYIIRRLLVLSAVNKLKRRLKKAQLVTSGEIQEKPRSFIDENKTNSQLIIGVDESGSSLFLKVILHKHRVAEIVLFLNIQGRTYCFPNDKKVLLCSTQGRVWQAGGLTITVVEPLRRLRITYNGVLRSSLKVSHVKFSLLWNCANAPFYFPQDAPSIVLADALANESWRNGDWIKLLGDEKGYEQYGVLQGTVKHDSKESTLYLRGFRKNYWGSGEHLTQYRDLLLFLIADDGLAFNVGAKSYHKGCSELKYGSVLSTGFETVPVDRHSISLEFVGEHKIPSNFVFGVSAKRNEYKCSVSLLVKQGLVAKGSGTLNIVPCKFTVNEQKANGFACFWYQSNEIMTLPEPLLIEPKLRIEPGTYVSSLREQVSRVQALAGDKSKYLALASTVSSNFIVPKGFVVLTTAFKSKQLDGDVTQAIVSELRRLSPENQCTWAVRFSGRSLLGCSETEVLKAIASSSNSSVAVLVQEMVHGDSSGVLYSCHPATGNPSQIVIESNDNYVVLNRSWNGMLTGNADEQTLSLGRAALELERAFGFFCKIDWTFSGATLYVLQIQPIEDIYKWTDDELLHEFDTPRMSKKQVPVLRSIGEMADGALTPLAGTIAKDLLEIIYRPFGTNLNLHKHQLNLVLSSTPKFNPWNVVKNIFARIEVTVPKRVSKSSSSDTFQTIEESLSDLDKVKKGLSLSVRKNIDHFLMLSKFSGSKISVHELLPSSSNFKIFHEIKRIADVIHQPAQISKTDVLSWLKAECPEGYKLLKKFLSRYGHRGVQQFDFSGPTWAERLDLIIEELKFQCDLKNRGSATIHSNKKPRNFFNRRYLTFLSKTFRVSFLERTQLQSVALEVFDTIRELVRDLSKQMTVEGLIPDSGLIHYFSLYELKRLVEEGDRISVAKAERRRKLYPIWNQTHLVAQTVPRGNFLGNGSKTTGRACVVKDVTDLNQLLPGDVLITASININWERYLLELSGLVTEDSDVRSFGIPCLVGVKGATAMFKTGNIVMLSKNHGTIKLLC